MCYSKYSALFITTFPVNYGLPPWFPRLLLILFVIDRRGSFYRSVLLIPFVQVLVFLILCGCLCIIIWLVSGCDQLLR